MMQNPVILYPWLYDEAKALGYNMAGFIRQAPIPMIEIRSEPMQTTPAGEAAPPRMHVPDISRMNRHERRAAMRQQTGRTWAQAREIAKRNAEMERRTSEFAAQAAKLTPEQAREALGKWAAAGGPVPAGGTIPMSQVCDPEKW